MFNLPPFDVIKTEVTSFVLHGLSFHLIISVPVFYTIFPALLLLFFQYNILLGDVYQVTFYPFYHSLVSAGNQIEVGDKVLELLEGTVPRPQRRHLPPTPGVLISPTPPPKPKRATGTSTIPNKVNMSFYRPYIHIIL